MRKWFLLFSLLVVLPASAQDKAESAYDRVMRTGVLRCGYFSWPPFFEKDPTTGAVSGVTYDIIEDLGKVLQLKIEWTSEYTLGQQVEALRTRKLDALCGDGPWTRGAVPYVDYTRPYMFIPGYVYVPQGNPKDLSIEKLNAPEYSFTMIDGDGSAEYLNMLFPKAKLLSLPSTADPSVTIENVLTGKADAVLNDPATIEAQSAHNSKKLVALNPDKALVTFPFVISLQKGQPDLLNMLNQGLDILNDTGVIAHTLKIRDPGGKKLKTPMSRYQEGQ